MREMIKMVVVLTILCAFSGGLLAAVRSGTKDKIEYQQLKFVKGPAIREILKGSSNDPIVDRFKLKVDDVEKSFFVGIFDGNADTVAFENFGKGFGGDIGVMLGVNVKNDKIVAVGVTTHSETPGVGSKAKTDLKFSAQFAGLLLNEDFNVKTDGGQIDAISGATVSSRGVCAAVSEAGKIYKELKPRLINKLSEFNK